MTIMAARSMLGQNYFFLKKLQNLILSKRASQNAEKVTHIKMRLLDQALFLFNCVPFDLNIFISLIQIDMQDIYTYNSNL